MNIRTTKKPDTRIAHKYLGNLGIKAYDADNLYPQNIRNIVASSPTGSTCLGRYAMFIEGNGFNSQELSDTEVNRAGDTVDDILRLVCGDMASYGGFALHVNYNILGEIVELNHVPFEDCRLEEEDDNGFVSHIITHPDWQGKKTRKGKVLKVSKETLQHYVVFNPVTEVVQAQIEKSGGIEYYKGQILWVSNGGKTNYPVCKYDGVVTEMSTDEGLANIKYRNVRNNFLPAGMLITRKGQSENFDGTEDYDNSEFAEGFKNFQGDMNACKMINVEIEMNEEKPEFVPFPTNNFDKSFNVTDESVVERIYAAFNQEAFYCIRSGKIGFSGTLLADAYADYAGQVTKEQRAISRAIKRVFDNWKDPLLTGLSSEFFKIEPLKYGGNTNA